VFTHSANSIVPSDSNGSADIFLRDRTLGTTTQMSVDQSGTPSNAVSISGAISPDGRSIVFASAGSNLVSGDTNGALDVFLKDRGAP
jgi:Tol biopolymer transport system component